MMHRSCAQKFVHNITQEVCRLKEAAARREVKQLLARVDASRLEQQKQLERLKASVYL